MIDDVQLIVFRLGGREFAVEILQVERILRYETPVAWPALPEFVDGTIVHHDDIPVLDLRRRFGLPAAVGEETRLMVLDLTGVRVAVVVDAAREVIRVDSKAIGPAGAGEDAGVLAAHAAGRVARGGRTIVIVNGRTLLTAAERDALRAAAGAGSLGAGSRSGAP